MKRAIVVIALIAISGGSCEFAQKHPSVTAGITGATVGFLGCEVDNVKISTCGAISGIVGLGLFGVVAIVNLVANTNAEEEVEAPPPPGTLRVRTHTEPPPVVVDAGVDAPAIVVDARPVDGQISD